MVGHKPEIVEGRTKNRISALVGRRELKFRPAPKPEVFSKKLGRFYDISNLKVHSATLKLGKYEIQANIVILHIL